MFKIRFCKSFLNHLQVDIPVPDPDYSHHALVFVNVDDVQPDLLPHDFAFQGFPGFFRIGLARLVHTACVLISFGRFRCIDTVEADPEFGSLWGGDLDRIAVRYFGDRTNDDADWFAG